MMDRMVKAGQEQQLNTKTVFWSFLARRYPEATTICLVLEFQAAIGNRISRAARPIVFVHLL